MLEICVETTADISYTATRDAQGPLHNLENEAFSPFSTWPPSDDVAVYSLSGPRRFFAGPGARSYGPPAATHPVV